MKPELVSSQFENELFQNILPFWMNHVLDEVNGGFFGGITNNLIVHNEIPRTAISCTRLLWTFSHAYLVSGDDKYINLAHSIYEYLIKAFWDDTYGGLFWSVDCHGRVVRDRKHHYAQAFGIYGLSEYYKATGHKKSIQVAAEIFNLLETHAYDPKFGGYNEGSTRDWSSLSDMRLSEKDLNCQKSMNTMLHLMEAYTNYLKVSHEKKVATQLTNLILIFQNKIISPANHFMLFFDADWTPLSNHVSFGHDIEGSWLLIEAAGVLGDKALIELASKSALRLASAVMQKGIRDDRAIVHEMSPDEDLNPNIEWWPQAEAVVGFYNAYQMTADEKYKTASVNSWRYINEHLVDRIYGGWIKRLLPDGSFDENNLKAGPWEGPYHEARMCFEMIKRLKNQTN